MAIKHEYTAPGDYVVTLRVTDSENNVGVTTKKAKVVAPVAPVPIIRKSASTGVAPIEMEFDGADTHTIPGIADGPAGIVSWEWNFGDGATGAETADTGLTRVDVNYPVGPPGATGAKGADSTIPGPTGPAGDTGPRGVDGTATETGATGPMGDTGPRGFVGDIGPTGDTGYTGWTGPQGIGDTGAASDVTGPTGYTGYTGGAGTPGSDGATGYTGYTGPAGSSGTDPWTIVKLGADFGTTGTSNIAVTGLKFTPAINKTYYVLGTLLLRTATATVGARPGIAWPSNLTDGTARVEASNALTTSALRSWGAKTTQNAASTGLATTADSHYGGIEALIITSGTTSGDFQITLASETAGTNVQMKSGSFIMYREL
jgi:hypothetical protein